MAHRTNILDLPAANEPCSKLLNLVEWVGKDFYPAVFDLVQANMALGHKGRNR